MSFVDYMGYRSMIIKAKIEECLQQLHAGETEIIIDPEDLTSDELACLGQEINRQLSRNEL